jgi:hypothetical protein
MDHIKKPLEQVHIIYTKPHQSVITKQALEEIYRTFKKLIVTDDPMLQ